MEKGESEVLRMKRRECGWSCVGQQKKRREKKNESFLKEKKWREKEKRGKFPQGTVTPRIKAINDVMEKREKPSWFFLENEMIDGTLPILIKVMM